MALENISPVSSRPPSRLPVALSRIMWGLFVVSIAASAWGIGSEASLGPWLHVDGLTQVMAVVVTFVSGIVHSFSRRYMAGDRRLNAFYVQLFALTGVVLFLTMADHVVLFGALWTGMGVLLSGLIGHVRGWPEAQAAARMARSSFLIGSGVLAGSLALLVHGTGAWTITEILADVGQLDAWVVGSSAGLLLLAAMIQSALVPFHRWLLSSMTAPTPVSAFMHAGLVNAGGILLARFAPVVFEVQAVMLVVVAVGAVSALAGQAWALVQSNVKRQLGCSTTAQMGFMVLQVGLGFVAAAIAHLVLHGFYKAYLFLASGSVVDGTAARALPHADSSPGERSGLHTIASIAAAGAGGALFARWTGKSLTALDSGTLLTVFVVLAVLHATHTLVRRAALPAATRLWAIPTVLLSSIGLYALVYNGVSLFLGTLPMVEAAAPLSPVHGLIALAFLIAFVAVERGWHRSSTRLYVALLNTSQPAPSTLSQRTRRHVH